MITVLSSALAVILTLGSFTLATVGMIYVTFGNRP